MTLSGCAGTCLGIIVTVEDIPQQLGQEMIRAFYMLSVANWSLCPAANHCPHVSVPVDQMLNNLLIKESHVGLYANCLDKCILMS